MNKNDEQYINSAVGIMIGLICLCVSLGISFGAAYGFLIAGLILIIASVANILWNI